MKKTLIYPSSTIAPSIYTDFINGVKFDICEIEKSAHNMLSSPKSRFFICCEDIISGFQIANNYFKKTGEERWDFFCKSKQECIDTINEFSKDYDRIEFLIKKAELKPVFKISCHEKIKNIREKNIKLFGVTPL